MVAGLGAAAIYALWPSSSDWWDTPPPVAVQPVLDYEELNTASLAELSYQESVTTSTNAAMDLIFPNNSYIIPSYIPSTDGTSITTPVISPVVQPNLPIYTNVDPVPQDPAVQEYIDNAAAMIDPSWGSTVGQALSDQPWYYWISPVGLGLTVFGGSEQYEAEQEAYDTAQANAAAMQQQLKADESTRQLMEGGLNFQNWYNYEAQLSLQNGVPFNWNDAIPAAAYLLENDPQDFDAFMEAWQTYGAQDQTAYSNMMSQVAPPQKPNESTVINAYLASIGVTKTTATQEQKDAAQQEYTNEYNAWKVAQQAYQTSAQSKGQIQLSTSVYEQIFETAYEVDSTTAEKMAVDYQQYINFNLGGSTYQNQLGSQVYQNLYNQLATGLPQNEIISPTATLSDGSVVEVYSGMVIKGGNTLQVGDQAFETDANGNIINKL